MIHPWIGLRATLTLHDTPAVSGVIVTVSVDWLSIMDEDGTFTGGPFHAVEFSDPAEARRRIEAAGQPAPDYEAIGRGVVREVFEFMAIQRGTHALGVLDIIGQAIGRGISAARGGGS